MYGEVPQEIKDKIRAHYDAGQGSLQDYARVYKVDMATVLEVCGETDLGQVEMIGDQVDQAEVGRGGTVNPGEIVDVPFTLN
jgi:hypothetical protein